MPHVKLTTHTPEGAPGNVVVVSRSRAQDLVNTGLAQRLLERPVAPDAPARGKTRR